jgi:cytochrome b6-f complex iron-sulfur subunit
MALVDDLEFAVDEREITRRNALLALGGGALAVGGLGAVVTLIRYMRPNVLFEPATKFKVGSIADLAVGGVLDIPKRKLFVARNEEGCFAMSAVCTHLGCMVQHQAAVGAKEAFFCPCHGSRFDQEGAVVGGPAPRPLDRVLLTIDGGELVVDVKETVPHGTVTEV